MVPEAFLYAPQLNSHEAGVGDWAQCPPSRLKGLLGTWMDRAELENRLVVSWITALHNKKSSCYVWTWSWRCFETGGVFNFYSFFFLGIPTQFSFIFLSHPTRFSSTLSPYSSPQNMLAGGNRQKRKTGPSSFDVSY